MLRSETHKYTTKIWHCTGLVQNCQYYHDQSKKSMVSSFSSKMDKITTQLCAIFWFDWLQ